MEFLLDSDGIPTPGCRAMIIGKVLTKVAMAQQPTEWGDVLFAVLREMGLKEEDGAPLIYDVIFILLRGGLILSDAWNEERQSMLVQGGTTLRPSLMLTHYIWGEDYHGECDT